MTVERPGGSRIRSSPGRGVLRQAGYPALAAWRARVRSGREGEDANNSGTWVIDAIWRAACYEAAAQDVEHTLPKAGRDLRREAKEVIKRALLEIRT